MCFPPPHSLRSLAPPPVEEGRENNTNNPHSLPPGEEGLGIEGDAQQTKQGSSDFLISNARFFACRCYLSQDCPNACGYLVTVYFLSF